MKRRLCSLSRATDSDLRVLSETPISFTLMIHHVVLYKLKPEVTPARVEAMMMNTRMQLLKIPEVLNIKCGKRIDPELPWQVRNLSRRLHFREIHGGSDQA